MRSDKLLIIDDKAESEQYSSENAIAQLSQAHRALIDHYKNVEGFWAEDEDDVKLRVDTAPYSFIFIHDSYDDPIIQGGLKESLIQKMTLTSTVILFSGTKKETRDTQKICSEDFENVYWYALRRSQYFFNLPRFMESRFIFGEYRLEYLYNSALDPKSEKGRILADEVRDLLERSASEAAASSAFIEFVQLFGGKYNEKVYERFANMPEDLFLSNLDRIIHKK